MTLKKNQIEEIKKKMFDTDQTQTIIEELAEPLFVDRMARYAKLMGKIYITFLKESHNSAYSLEMTKIVFDYILKSGQAQIPVTEKTEVDYAR